MKSFVSGDNHICFKILFNGNGTNWRSKYVKDVFTAGTLLVSCFGTYSATWTP